MTLITSLDSFYPVAEDLDPSNRIKMHQFGVFTNIFHITEWIFFV